ncbi:MAG: YfcE family phosphodiesterase [Pseudomonadales bacterium]|jgi:putative phosphoesterase|nr:YfcE family phosphodiesterase [Pseudomonadales bacterium]
MRIGIVSDTHNHRPNVARIVELFNGASVDRVIHTGDITQARTLEIFAGLDAPLLGVFGNNDLGELPSLAATASALGFHFVDPPLRLVWHGRRILVVHDPLDLEAEALDEIDLVLHGHTHRHRLERDGGRLTFNPGECAGHMAGLNAVGIVDLDRLAAELLHF